MRQLLLVIVQSSTCGESEICRAFTPGVSGIAWHDSVGAVDHCELLTPDSGDFHVF